MSAAEMLATAGIRLGDAEGGRERARHRLGLAGGGLLVVVGDRLHVGVDAGEQRTPR